MGTPGFALPSLDALVEGGQELVAVATQPDRPRGRGLAVAAQAVKRRAVELGLRVLQPENPADAGVDSARLARYRALMRALGVESLERSKGRVLFIMSTYGLSVSGSSKSYLYSDTPPAPLVGDTESDADGPTGEVYRHIEGNWYIVYEWDAETRAIIRRWATEQGGLLPREITVDEIEELIDKFALSTEYAAKAGFDGIEIN